MKNLQNNYFLIYVWPDYLTNKLYNKNEKELDEF